MYYVSIIWSVIAVLAAFYNSATGAVAEMLLQEAVFLRETGKYLPNRVLRTEQADSEMACGRLCTRDSSCLSVNYKSSGKDQGRCELNDKPLEQSKDGGLIRRPEYIHLSIVDRSCEVKDHIFSTSAKKCVITGHSCKEILQKNGSSTSGVYILDAGNPQEYPVYCHMTDIPGCGGGGWTLLLKMDGSKSTFGYSASYWSDNMTYNVPGGLAGLTNQESKLESYWKTPFTKICLGMDLAGVRNWMAFDYTANSLHAIIADGVYRRTSAGRAAWKSLLSQPSIQENCNDEGFNFRYQPDDKALLMRIGLPTNDENNCWTCDSWIGFGVFYVTSTYNQHITCGNVAKGNKGYQYGQKYDATIGYILVQ